MTKTKTKENTKYFVMNHDAFIRRSMARKKVAMEFFEANLPKHILKEVDLKTLKLEKSDFVDRTLGKGIVDLLFSVQWGKELGYISLLLEAQSLVDTLMPFRIVKYMLQLCDLHLTKNKGEKLPIIYPLILYSGKEPYTAPRSFWEMFTHPKLAKQCFTDSFYVLSLRDIKSIDMRYRYHSGVVLSLMREIHRKNILPHLKELMPVLELVGKLDLHLLEDMLRYTLDSAKSKERYESIIQLFVETASEKNKGEIMSIADQIRKEGEIRGIEKGIEKGRMSIINNMLASNISIDIISKATKLSPEEIEKLKKNSSSHIFN